MRVRDQYVEVKGGKAILRRNNEEVFAFIDDVVFGFCDFYLCARV